MELDKRKYKRDDVYKIINSVETEYKGIIADQKGRINQLIEENKNISAQLSEYKRKEELISDTLKNSTQKADEIKKEAELRYSAEMEKLINFSTRFDEYVSGLLEKFPKSTKLQEAYSLLKVIQKLLAEKSSIQVKIKTISASIDGKNDRSVDKDEVFDPKQKIADYIAATEDNGFNIDEVLNPGKLELEELCKELGLMEED